LDDGERGGVRRDRPPRRRARTPPGGGLGLPPRRGRGGVPPARGGHAVRQGHPRGDVVNELLERLRLGAEQLIFILPPLLAALVLRLADYFQAHHVGGWLDATLRKLNFKAMADDGGLTEAVVRTGKQLDPGSEVDRLAFWLVKLGVILLASAALGLESINEM